MNNIDAFTRRQGDGWTRCVLIPKKRTSCRNIHGLIVIMCCSHKLHKFAPYMKETSLFLGYTDWSCFFAVWGRGWCIFFLGGGPFFFFGGALVGVRLKGHQKEKLKSGAQDPNSLSGWPQKMSRLYCFAAKMVFTKSLKFMNSAAAFFFGVRLKGHQKEKLSKSWAQDPKTCDVCVFRICRSQRDETTEKHT